MSRPTDASRSRRAAWLIVALAALTGLLGVLAVLAPVIADDPVVRWPRAGAQPTSTVLPLSPYRPLQLDATVPCATLAALDARGGGEALRTLPADVGAAPGEGLTVAVERGTVTVSASGAELVSQPLPAQRCGYRVDADAQGVRVSRDGAPLAVQPDLRPPQVAQLQTDATGPAAAGLAVELHTDARYQSRPTPLKIALIVGHALALAGLLALAWRRWRGTGPGLVTPRPSLADAVVVAVSLTWGVLGPLNIDDSWYLLMARNAAETGYIGNYASQFNVTENPFSTSQYVMQAWGALGGWGLAWQRLLPVAYGLATYALLRVFVTTALRRTVVSDSGSPDCRNHSRARLGRAVAWAVAGAHLLWWLPYGITLRPEPLIVLGTAGVLVLTELARRRESIGVLAAATAVAALTMTVSPSALVASAPLVAALPWLWRWLRAADLPHRTGAVLLAGASASVVVLPGFADASLGDVLESTAVHRWYYRQHPWYEEFLHYSKVLETGDPGSWGRRLPVLLTLAVLVGVAVATGRRAGTGGPLGRLLLHSGALTALALAALVLTPTKWVNHFGAVAAVATVLLAAAVLRSPIPHRAPAAGVAVGSVAVGAAAAVGYAGPNLWRPYSDWGQPFGVHTQLSTPYEISLTTPGIGPLELRNPLLWLAVGLAAVWWVHHRRRRGRPSRLRPDRVLLITAGGLAVVLMLAVFTLAPLRQYPGPSVALTNIQALTGSPCGLAGDVRVLADAERGLGTPVGAAHLAGDMRTGELPGLPLPQPGPTVWHDDIPDGTGAGALTTPWYPIPPGVGDGAVVVPVAGALAQQQLAVEFGTGRPGSPAAVRTVELTAGDSMQQWTQLSARLPAGDGAAPSAVRVIVEDLLVGPASWIAVAQPRLAVPRPVTAVTSGRPVFADQASASLWPCVDQIVIANGIAEPPQLRLRAGDGIEHATEPNTTLPFNGGTLAQVDRTVQWVELPSTLSPPGVPTLGWGHVERASYDHPVGLVDLRVDRVHRAGWVRLPTIAGQDYSGRKFIG